MLKSRKWINAAIVAMFAAFAYSVTQLYVLRFTSGDVYPPYSSYRADPVGTRALYESLNSLSSLHVERHAKPFSVDSVRNTIGNRRSTWMVLGATVYDPQQPLLGPNQMPLDFARAVEQIMQPGGRVVITLQPTFEDLQEVYEVFETRMERIDRMRDERSRGDDETTEQEDDDEQPEEDQTDRTDQSDGSDQQVEAPEREDSAQSNEADGSEEPGDSKNTGETRNPYEDLIADVSLDDRWGVRLAFDEVEVDEFGRAEPQVATRVADLDLPGSVSWRTAVWFDELSDDWSVLYERDGKPILIERPFGAGTLVFSADSYFLSNEALRDERHPDLLAWLVGPNQFVVFEESHLGVARTPGVMTLIRGYGLYGVFWGLIALGVLFLWKNAVSFVPPYADELPSDARHAAGRDSAAGFANLIRRSVRPRELLVRCIAQYKHSLGARRDDLKKPIREMEAIAELERNKSMHEWNPVEAYRRMCRVLEEHRKG